MDYTIGWNLSNSFLKGTDKQPLQIQVYHHGKQFRVGVKIHITKAEYQQLTSGKFIRGIDLNKIKTKMNETEQRAKAILNDLKVINKENFSSLFFSDINVSKPKATKYLKDIFNETIEDYRKLNKSVATYELALKSFTKYSGELRLVGTDSTWIVGYKVWMANNGRSAATANLYLRCLKVVWNIQIKKGLIHAKHYPFKDIKINTARKTKKALLPEDIKALWLYTPLTDVECKAKDYWFFCYYCNGMNPADALRLKYKNIQGDKIVFVRQKTKDSGTQTEIIVNLINESKDIIKRYASIQKLPDEYIFPELRNKVSKYSNEDAIINARNYLNKRLKRIGKKLGLKELPILGNSRHSFATTMLLNGERTLASRMLGHANANTTEHYFATLPVEYLKKVTESLVPLP